MLAVAILFLSGIAYYSLNQLGGADEPTEIVQKKDETPVIPSTVPARKEDQIQPAGQLAVAEKSVVKRLARVEKAKVHTITRQTKTSDGQMLIASKNDDETITGRNIQVSPGVINEKPGVDIRKMETVNNTALTSGREIIDEAVGTVERNPYAFNASNEEIEILNTSVSKKSKLRGLFRKVSRVVEKTTNIETDGKGIRIASFEIGLK